MQCSFAGKKYVLKNFFFYICIGWGKYFCLLYKNITSTIAYLEEWCELLFCLFTSQALRCRLYICGRKLSTSPAYWKHWKFLILDFKYIRLSLFRYFFFFFFNVWLSNKWEINANKKKKIIFFLFMCLCKKEFHCSHKPKNWKLFY